MKYANEGRPSILIVDDEKENLTGFKYLFDDIYDVFCAESAAEGRKILEQNNIQVVISDQRMPVTTGVEFLENVLADFPDTIRMILTGYSDFDTIIDAVNKGKIYYYFTKPWNESEMKMIIENALEVVRLQNKLQQNEESFQQLSNNIKEVFWLISVDLTTLFHVSPAFVSIFEIDQEAVYDNPLIWLETVHPDDQKQVQDFINKAVREVDSELYLPEFKIRLKGNTIRCLSLKLSPVKDKSGCTYRYAGLMENISEQKVLAESKVQSKNMAAMGGLAAGIAHELNNPLSIILQSAQLIKKKLSFQNLKEDELTDEDKSSLEQINQILEKIKIYEKLGNIEKAGARASKIINDMLSFSRKRESNKTKLQVQRILDDMINLTQADFDLEDKFGFKHINIIRDIDEGIPPVLCNESEIGQVVLNLLRNAAQSLNSSSAENAKEIKVRGKLIEKDVLIEIEDNGPGMDNSVLSRVFEPFFTTKPKDEGTGLGLSISHKIICANHQGNLSVTSQPGQGATFRILLPV
jgi:signal transduction histidine kinase/FixJ family two-component response regulator